MLLGAFTDVSLATRALDLGAGTGVLSLMLAQKNPRLIVDAIELDGPSADECAFNFQQSNWKERLHVFTGDYLIFPFENQYDLIVSNPPYHLENVESTSEEKERAKRTNLQALDLFFSRIQRLLTEKGNCWLILPLSNLSDFQKAWKKSELYCVKEIHIHSKPSKLNTRRIVVLSKSPTEKLEQSDFFIREENNKYSEAYKKLTLDFHAKAI